MSYNGLPNESVLINNSWCKEICIFEIELKLLEFQKQKIIESIETDQHKF